VKNLREPLIFGAVIVVLAIVAAISLWKRPDASFQVLEHRPQAVMGTATRLLVVPPPGDVPRGEATLSSAERELRRVEALMSVRLDISEISRLNQAAAGDFVPLSTDSVAVLMAARQAHDATHGAFDVTLGPLIKLWREGAVNGVEPAAERLQAARDSSKWSLLQIRDDGAVKAGDGLQVDLGGIAKGYAIDRGIAAMRNLGMRGGVVDVGGDVRAFGTFDGERGWPVDILDPFSPDGRLGRFSLRDKAVCTSGDYARTIKIRGAKFSHIIDPRSLRPAAFVPSVSVIADTAMEADAWATAMSVLGPEEGFALLPPELDALMVVGTEGDYRVLATEGFARYLTERPAHLEVIERAP